MAKCSSVMGPSQCEWPMSLATYPTVRCFASTASLCFSAARKNPPGYLSKAILIQLNRNFCHVIGACLFHTSGHHTLSFLSWLSCTMRVMLFCFDQGHGVYL